MLYNFYKHETKSPKIKNKHKQLNQERRLILTPIRRQYCIFLVDYILRTKRSTKNVDSHSVVLSLVIVLYCYFETMFIYIIG